MTFPAYPEYKDSSVVWLGDIPSHWNIKRFRYVFVESPEKITYDVVGEMLSVSGYRGIEVKQYDDEGRRRTDEELFGYRVVRPGQLVVNTMWLNYAGLGVSEYEGHVSPAYRSYWIDPEIDKRFIHHLMRSGIYVQGYTQLLTGIRPNSLQMGRDDLMVFPVLLPAKFEQTQIARFLDHETARIDALIEEQQRLIELLKEKRQAVISHAVTKGLDPTVPMKDSGVKWLGEVPVHWGISRLKYHSTKIGDGLHATPQYDDEGDYFFINGNNLVDGKIVITPTTRQVSQQEFLAHRVQLDSSTVLLSINGTIGNLALYNNEPVILGKSAAYINCIESLFRLFCLYLCSSVQIKHYFGSQLTGTTIYNLSLRTIAETPIPLPPINEQKSIVEFLKQHTDEFDELIDNAVRLSNLLQERRSALISAAVTGKIDLRGWQPPGHVQIPELEEAEAV